MRYLVFLVLAVIVIVFLVQRAQDEKKADDASKKESLHDYIDQTTDYLTGKTHVTVLSQAKKNRLKMEMQHAVGLFEGIEGRKPRSLEELRETGYITEEQMYVDRGRRTGKLLSGQTQDGRFYIQWVGRDEKAGTSDDWYATF